MEQFYRYILRASGIIFIIDPFQFPGIRSQLPHSLRARIPVVNHDPAEIVSCVINLFERRQAYARDRKSGYRSPSPSQRATC